MAEATPEELRQWREAAVAAGNKADIAAIDAELAKVQPLHDLSPLEDAYKDRRMAIASGAPKDIIDAIDSHIHSFTQKMADADRQRTLEEMGAGGRFLAGAGAGLTNVWEHAKDLAHELGSDVALGGAQERMDQVPLMEQNAGNQQPLAMPSVVTPDRQAERAQFASEVAPLTNTTAGYFGNLTGEAAGTAPIALATGGMGPVVGGAAAGAGTGALMAEPGERLKGALIGGGTGAAIGALAKAASVPIKPKVEVSPAARQLRELGVEGITAGQAAPRSSIAHIEQAGESGPLGAAVKAAREEFPQNLEQRIIAEAAPPGYTPLTREQAPDVLERLAHMKREHSQQYQALIGNGPVPKNHIQHDVLNYAMNPPGVGLSPQELKTASGVVADELGRLDAQPTTATLHEIRSNLGQLSREVAESNPVLSRYYKDVKNVVSGHLQRDLKASLDPQAWEKLQALDKQYAKFKIVLDAASRRGDAAGAVQITPDKLSQALKGSMTNDAFATGQGGTLRVLARAGKQVVSPPRPTTGALQGILNAYPIPYVGKYVRAGQAYMSSHFPDYYLGQTLPQRVLQRTLMQPVVRSELGAAARAGVLDKLLQPSAGADYLDGVPETPPPAVLTQTVKGKKR